MFNMYDPVDWELAEKNVRRAWSSMPAGELLFHVVLGLCMLTCLLLLLAAFYA